MSNNGRGKLTEELGELLQVAGKIEAMKGDLDRPHWDGKGALRLRFEDELADVIAACSFNIDTHGLDVDKIMKRATEKKTLFELWHADTSN